MTAGAYDQSEWEAADTPARRRIHVAPFGWYTRLRVRSYFQHAFVVTAGLMAIALSIDLSPRLSQVLAANPEAKGLWLVPHLAWYLGLRAVDFATRLLPLGAFLGVLWAEVMHTFTRERVTIWNSGRSPLQCLIPVLIFGACLGILTFVLEAYMRPAAVAVQAATKLGEYGERFNRQLSTDRFWIAAGDDLVHTRIDYGPPPSLVDATIYRHGPDGRLMEVISARTATLSEREGVWILHHGNRWRVGDDPPAGADQTAQTKVEPDEEISLKLDPLWLSHYRIYAKFLPQDVLQTLANTSGGRYATSDYLTWLHFRYAEIFYPGAMALLAASLSLLLMSHAVRVESVLIIGFAGYGGHVSLRACLMMGENGYLSPVIAGWFTPSLVISASLAVLAVVHWQNGRHARQQAQTA